MLRVPGRAAERDCHIFFFGKLCKIEDIFPHQSPVAYGNNDKTIHFWRLHNQGMPAELHGPLKVYKHKCVQH